MRNYWQSFRRLCFDILGIGERERDPDPMDYRTAAVLIAMAAALTMVMIAGNLMALKIWRLSIPWPQQAWPIKVFVTWKIPVDAGILLFPVSYVVGDLLVNIYGLKASNLVAILVAGFAVFTALTLWVARVLLPDYPGADNEAFTVVQSATGRIFLASIAGFLSSQLLNNWVFVYLRQLLAGHYTFRSLAIISSLFARTVDVLVFEVLAFAGKLPLGDFIRQVIFAYVAGAMIELLVSGLTARLALKLDHYLGYADGHNLKQ